MESFKKIMRYNNFMNDPLGKNKWEWAIAARHDLDPDPDNNSCWGATDAKVWSVKEI